MLTEAPNQRLGHCAGDVLKLIGFDGQMCMEEDRVALQAEEVHRTRYGLGPRGIDWIETSISGSQRNQQYPLYDGHGNMIDTISLEGDLANLRAYDAWGGVRAQAGVTTDPNTRYCANLGHKQDDESGLIYMRARFYDSGTGSFISQDPAMDGANWFVYCNNDPVNMVDADGRSALALGLALGFAVYFCWQFYSGDSADGQRAMRYFGATVAAMTLNIAIESSKDWMLRAAYRMAALLRMDYMMSPDQIGYRWSRNAVRIAFYAGYTLFLVFTMYYLEAWAEGEAQ
ncbi:MAG: RHS repeat-associated core domain-containing protein [Fimbriimonadaceae bacterium]|nr:RHS repeat-associated core domain-containing protein [Fimbriimonadaceae bacterium]